MSLLLDALKKAAEKKAQKAAEQSGDAADQTAHDKTEQVTRAEHTAITSSEIDATRPMTDFHTSIADDDETQVAHDDQTQIDATQLDATQIDPTRVDATHLDATHLDVTETVATQLDETRIDATEISADDSEETLLQTTRLDATQIDATQVDATHIDATQLDATDMDSTHLDSTRLDATQLDAPAEQAIETDSTLLDTARMEAAELARTAVHDVAQDDDDTIVGEGEEVQIPGNSTVIDSTQSMPAPQTPDTAAPETLTEDDVTEFMGDGYRDHVSASSDDTTITNADALTLTSFKYEDEDEDVSLVLNPDATESDTFSLRGAAAADETSTASLSLQGIPEDDRPTEISGDSTSTTGAQVDLDKLTSDETVTVEGQTSTRTFAPDNYDRTLINMSDKDVSRIFAGMKTESDAVMTPDYAKKVFLSKSGKVKAGYYKWYAGLAVLLLLAVVLYGMFQLVDESEVIDQRLASLKRDPMPGVIKPQKPKQEPVLFSEEKQQADAKAAQILASAEALESEAATGAADTGSEQEAQATEQNATPETAEQAAPAQTASAESEQESPAAQSTTAAAAASKPAKTAKARITRKAATPASKKESAGDAPLVISSSSQTSRKAKVLMSAYQAWLDGDMQSAAAQYDQALALDPVDRDALLGRAAVYIQQNQYQQAIDLYQRLLEQNPKDSMAMTSLISVANIDPQAGESQLKSMLSEQPESPYLHFALGNIYGSQQRWNEAQKAYFNALKLKPQDADYAYNLAVSLDHIGQKTAAAQFYRRALDFSASSRANFDTRLAAERLEVLTR